MSGPFAAIVARDLRLAARRRADALLPIAFFTVAISLFPLGVGPEPQTLRQIAPGVVWVAALLAAMLSVTQLYSGDLADGSLEQMLVASGPGTLDKLGLVLAKAAAHWLVTGLPLVIVAPLFGLMPTCAPRRSSRLALTLAARHAGAQPARRPGRGADARPSSGAALLILLIVPLCIPALDLRRRRGGGDRCRPVGARATIRCSAPS
jgi:heme exporter protein B